MNGVWFAAMVAILVGAGVVAQLGWQLPEKAEVKRVFRLHRPRSGLVRAAASTTAAAADPR
ncbi:hypothetical protein BST36_03420 [Mycolicibacterium moriokaense]|jgi:hypothetical protein|uniref:Uncharacterized protein n=1 Tax=Mycolicibacterium moriokaense TaxID=39691 RepID=A0AAD1M7S4_9MYCO|nr:hypothetical protein [Mycolicibacterium moriokaense]MCV7040536.1 hypothetical protein [Mycolicibacterium moriokaense]ORB26303.1 hypothetical protein BST36_03420 [Mycolicibacterium moriokaense]BBX02764.1 hypothetical protein MMOR_37000 [Mycolicibacterium moriokaense]